MSEKKNLQPLKKAADLMGYTEAFVGTILEAGIIQGSIEGNNLKKYLVDMDSLNEFIQKRENGYELPNPAQMWQMIQDNYARLGKKLPL